MKFPSLVLLCLTLLTAGCGKSSEPPPENMLRHVLGALQIADAQERDAALAKACREAAEEGSGPTVLMGVPRIEDEALRDKVAEASALALHESGEPDAAKEVARLITREDQRQAVLSKLGR